MNAYLVTLVFQIAIENQTGNTQFDEQIRILKADCHEDAWEKAHTLGLEEEEHFFNIHKEKVSWKFIAPADVVPMHGLPDGGQVYSLTHETDDAEMFISRIQAKSLLSQTYLAATSQAFG